MDLLIASLLALLVGPLLVRMAGDRSTSVAVIDGFVVVAIVGLALVSILPHSIEVVGWWALLAAGGGMAAPLIAEKSVGSRARRAEGRQKLLLMALAGLAVHAFADGVALRAGDFASEQPYGGLLAFGVILHRIPLGVAIQARVEDRRAWFLLAVIAAATVAGFAVGASGLPLLENSAVAVFQAFVGGSLLHVAAASPAHSRGTHAPGGTAAGIGAVVAAVLPGILVWAEPELHHHGPGEMWETFVGLSLESAPALLLGFLAAGLLQVFMSERTVAWLRGGSESGRVLRGMLFGLPLPLCSCGVLPVYRSLVNAGAPTGAALAFLVATPEIGVDAFLLSLPLLGFDMAMVRLGAAAVAAVAVGVVVGRAMSQGAEPRVSAPPVKDSRGLSERLLAGLRFGLLELFDHTMPWVVAGLLVAAVIEPLLDAGWFASLPAGVDVVAMAFLGMPTYVCASGATAFVAVLLYNGLSPGAAIAFLLTGPATNMTTIGVLWRLHGRDGAMAFAVFVPVVAVALGLSVNAMGVGTVEAVGLHEHGEGPSILQQGSLAVLLLLLAGSFLRRGPRAVLGELVPSLHSH